MLAAIPPNSLKHRSHSATSCELEKLGTDKAESNNEVNPLHFWIAYKLPSRSFVYFLITIALLVAAVGCSVVQKATPTQSDTDSFYDWRTGTLR